MTNFSDFSEHRWNIFRSVCIMHQRPWKQWTATFYVGLQLHISVIKNLDYIKLAPEGLYEATCHFQRWLLSQTFQFNAALNLSAHATQCWMMLDWCEIQFVFQYEMLIMIIFWFWCWNWRNREVWDVGMLQHVGSLAQRKREENIARGTTDPGYWVRNLSNLSAQKNSN